MHSFIKLAFTCATLLSTSVAMAGNASAVQPTTDVFFAFDSSDVGEGTSGRLTELADWSALHPYTKIVLDGHTDSTGSEAYNIGLSSRRTESVQASLVALGVPASRIYRGIYGEDGVRSSSRGDDRRVTIWTTEQSLYELIQHSLVLGTAMMWNTPVAAIEIDQPQSSTLVATAQPSLR
jgi:flagellar motor protein MotB